MRKILACLGLVLVLTACTPEQQFVLAWVARPARAPCAEWTGAFRLAGFTESELPTMLTLVRRESRCLPWAIGRTDDWGLAQIHASWLGALCGHGIACTRRELLNPGVNARAARYVFTVSGWRAWATY